MQDILDRGDAHAVVRVLPNFARDLARQQKSAEVQVLLDGTQFEHGVAGVGLRGGGDRASIRTT